MAMFCKKHKLSKLCILSVLCVILTAVTGCSGQQKVDKPGDAVSPARADLEKGWYYDRTWQMHLAELYYKKAFESFKDPVSDWQCYGEAGYRYAFLVAQRGDMEEALTIINSILSKAENNPDFPLGYLSSMLQLVANCQLNLNMYDEAKETFAKAYEHELQVAGGENLGEFNMIVVCCNLFEGYLRLGEYDNAKKWLHRCEEETQAFAQNGDSALTEEYRGHMAIFKAQYLQATGHPTEAAAVYDAIPASRIVNPFGFEGAAKYLMEAGRYSEAAAIYTRLDSTYAAADSGRMDFDRISQCLQPRYIASRKAGATDEALRMADHICEAIDSALIWQKQSDAAELAIIYQTQEKELALQESQDQARFYRILSISVAIILLLIAYLLWRTYRYNRELMEKNRSLYQQIQQKEKTEEQAQAELAAKPADSLTPNQQLYNHLCELMKNPEVYTDAETNHETLARMLGTNHTYIYAALHECADTTPADFINLYRIRHAARLLTRTDDPVGLIIEQSGITNRSTFNRLFREHYSMSPSEFRQAARAELC